MDERSARVRERVKAAVTPEMSKPGATELARMLGVSRGQVYRYSRGENVPSLENAVTFAQHFRLSLSYLAALDADEPEERAIAYLRLLGPAEKAAVISKLEGWVEATVAAREVIATPRKEAATTKRTPGDALVSAQAPGASPPAGPAAEFPTVRPRRGSSPRKRPPA